MQNRKRIYGTLASLIIFLSLSGCSTQSTANQNLAADEPVKAVIANPSAQSLNEISGLIQKALATEKLTLSENIFTKSNVLVIEKKATNSKNTQVAYGRNLDTPERFFLTIKNKQCLLTQEKTKTIWKLQYTQCKAASPE